MYGENMTKGWKNDKYQHKLAAKGIMTKGIVWFASRGHKVPVVTMYDADKMLKLESRGYAEDSKKIAFLPSEKAEESIEWLEHEWSTATPTRKAELKNLIKSARTKIQIALSYHVPDYTKQHLKASDKMYKKFIEQKIGGN
jgi:hypothetical protein